MNDSAPRSGPLAPALSRRGFMAVMGGVGGALLVSATGQSALAATTPTPKLPGEYFRKANQVTAAGTVFDNICVRINGDTMRLHVPQTVKPNSGVPVPVVWFYHGSGSDHNALDGGFKSHAAAMVDRGAIAICQTAGGTLYSHPTAVGLQAAGWSYVAGLFKVSGNVLRATSGGGALAIETYATRLIPSIVGMYVVNGTYDIRDAYNAGGDRRNTIVAAFGDDPAAIDAANPARHPASAWAGAKMRIVVAAPSETDQIVPPDTNGLALIARAQSTATEATVRTHGNGHSTPGFALSDFVATAERWGGRGAKDTVAPTARLTSPANGSTVSGYVDVTAEVGDNVGVVDVGIYVGSTRMIGLTKRSETVWGARIWTKSAQTPNGTYTVTARASDAAGNVGVSSPIQVTVRN